MTIRFNNIAYRNNIIERDNKITTGNRIVGMTLNTTYLVYCVYICFYHYMSSGVLQYKNERQRLLVMSTMWLPASRLSRQMCDPAEQVHIRTVMLYWMFPTCQSQQMLAVHDISATQ